MADPYELYSFDGNDISVASNYEAMFRYSDPFAVSGTVNMQARRSVEPQVMSVSRDGRTVQLYITRRGTGISEATFRSTIKQWFTPGKNTAVRYLVFYADDGATLVRVPVYVQSLEPIEETDQHYLATLVMAQPWFEANTATTSAANPATVTNSGNVAARPSVALTQTTHKTIRACTVVPATGWGFTNYPVLFALSDTAATNTNVFTFVNGVSVPNYVINSGGASSGVWCLCDGDPSGATTYVDIIYGTGITNPLCHTLTNPGMFASTGSGNSAWLWSDWSITTYPDMCGAWLPSNTGHHRVTGSADVVWRLDSDGSSATFVIDFQGDTNYDSMEMRVPTGIDFSATSLDSFSRTTTGFGGTMTRAFVKARYPNDDRWTILWSTRANATVTTDISGTDGATCLAAGVEQDDVGSSGVDDCQVAYTHIGSGARVNILHPPTVTVGAAANVDYYNGTLTVGSYVVTFTNTFAPDATLTIDAGTMSISSSGSGHVFNAPTFSDPAVWMALEPGSNTITDALTATAADTWTFRSAFE